MSVSTEPFHGDLNTAKKDGCGRGCCTQRKDRAGEEFTGFLVVTLVRYETV